MFRIARSDRVAQMYRQNPNIEPLVPPVRLMLFLIAAFCRLAKLLSHSEQMGWLVGAVGIEIASLTSKSCWRKALPTVPQTNC
jgi:hypothetical protein